MEPVPGFWFWLINLLSATPHQPQIDRDDRCNFNAFIRFCHANYKYFIECEKCVYISLERNEWKTRNGCRGDGKMRNREWDGETGFLNMIVKYSSYNQHHNSICYANLHISYINRHIALRPFRLASLWFRLSVFCCAAIEWLTKLNSIHSK